MSWQLRSALRGKEVIYGQVLGFSLRAVTFPMEGVLQAGVHARVVTLGSRVALAGILQISPWDADYSGSQFACKLELERNYKGKVSFFLFAFLGGKWVYSHCFLGISSWEKSVVSRLLRGKTLSVHLEIWTPVYLVPYQNVNFGKTQTSEKNGVFSEGSDLIPGLTGVDWSNWQTPHLLWLSRGDVAVLNDEQIP